MSAKLCASHEFLLDDADAEPARAELLGRRRAALLMAEDADEQVRRGRNGCFKTRYWVAVGCGYMHSHPLTGCGVARHAVLPPPT
jgi:hypothetical protein